MSEPHDFYTCPLCRDLPDERVALEALMAEPAPTLRERLTSGRDLFGWRFWRWLT